MKAVKRLWQRLLLLHPRNLEKEVHIYGYDFSWRSHLALIVGALAGIGAIGLLFRLTPFHFILVIGAVILVLPILVLDLYKRMYEQKRFADVADYMEQMLYAFQKTGKIVSAWKECREIFADGQMRRCLDAAIVHAEVGKPQSEEGVLREGMTGIEQCYGCAKLSMVHGLLEATEAHGGMIGESVEILLADIERWKKRGYQREAEKKKAHVDNMISIVVAVLLCAVALYVLQAMGGLFGGPAELDIFAIPLIQASSVIFILCLLHIYVKSERKLTDDWLRERKLHEPEYLLRCYALVVDQNEQKKRSFPWALLPAVAAILCLAAGYQIGAVLSLALMIVMLLWHTIDRRLARRDVTEELYLSLPQWLMELMLLLQNNNVQVALTRSMEHAPAILDRELAELNRRLAEQPDRLSSYTAFCQAFDLPEVTSCMKMLHAFSERGTGNLQIQMNHLIEQVGRMQDMADQIQNEKMTFGMRLIFSYPVLAATAKLLLDLTAGMVVMLQMLGRMGGM